MSFVVDVGKSTRWQSEKQTMKQSERVQNINMVAVMLRGDGFKVIATKVETIAEKVGEGHQINARTRLNALYSTSARFRSCAGITPYLDLLQPLLQ